MSHSRGRAPGGATPDERAAAPAAAPPQAYLNSSTADEAARQGLGGLQGGLLVGFAIGAVALVTFLGAEAPGPETLQTVRGAEQLCWLVGSAC